MNPITVTVAVWAVLVAPGALAASAVESLEAAYRSAGAGPFSTGTGADAWRREVPPRDGGAPRSCATCHGADPRSVGRHATTGKIIEPLAPAVSPGRLSDPEHVEKWFRRNCEWTWGRACTPQEKGDFLAYLRGVQP